MWYMVQALLFTPDLIVNMLVHMKTISEFGKGSILHKMTTTQELILVFGWFWLSKIPTFRLPLYSLCLNRSFASNFIHFEADLTMCH